jgi:hypothetical protein
MRLSLKQLARIVFILIIGSILGAVVYLLSPHQFTRSNYNPLLHSMQRCEIATTLGRIRRIEVYETDNSLKMVYIFTRCFVPIYKVNRLDDLPTPDQLFVWRDTTKDRWSNLVIVLNDKTTLVLRDEDQDGVITAAYFEGQIPEARGRIVKCN